MMLPRFHPMHLSFGLILWAAWFVVLYGGTGVVCGVAPPPLDKGVLTWLNGTLLVGGVIVSLYLAYCAYDCWKAAPDFEQGKHHRRFIGRVAAGVYLFAAISAIAVTLPVVIFPPCI
ncbi:MAG TPA: hypothetical protein ENI17_04520 [Pseudomonas xinjiangensis]|uniref:Transmembrane protein n=2 Tax=root TaxID=1 RepID=A0A7V1FRW7_9GAMM|nr:hypothetical protein [Halopseudomonas xinjiangensis]HEC46873.1 hypothetical protein [Halopseudomonas xinjiangensis]